MLLRRFTGADAGALAALYGDPRVMRFITTEPPTPAEVAARILPEYLREYRELTDGLGAFAAIEKETGRAAPDPHVLVSGRSPDARRRTR